MSELEETLPEAEPAPEPAADATAEAEPANEPAADQTSTLAGHRLDEMGGVQVGRIEGQTSGRAEWLIARMGRFGHYCLVPGRDAVVANGRVWVPYSRDQIRRAPRIEPKAPLDSDSEATALGHYGLS
jgi:hypothetical protein